MYGIISLNLGTIGLLFSRFFANAKSRQCGKHHKYDMSLVHSSHGAPRVRYVVYLYSCMTTCVQYDDDNMSMRVLYGKTWTDYRLTWNADEFSGLSHIYLSTSDVWIPDVTLYNKSDNLLIFKLCHSHLAYCSIYPYTNNQQ